MRISAHAPRTGHPASARILGTPPNKASKQGADFGDFSPVDPHVVTLRRKRGELWICIPLGGGKPPAVDERSLVGSLSTAGRASGEECST